MSATTPAVHSADHVGRLVTAPAGFDLEAHVLVTREPLAAGKTFRAISWMRMADRKEPAATGVEGAQGSSTRSVVWQYSVPDPRCTAPPS